MHAVSRLAITSQRHRSPPLPVNPRRQISRESIMVSASQPQIMDRPTRRQRIARGRGGGGAGQFILGGESEEDEFSSTTEQREVYGYPP